MTSSAECYIYASAIRIPKFLAEVPCLIVMVLIPCSQCGSLHAYRTTPNALSWGSSSSRAGPTMSLLTMLDGNRSSRQKIISPDVMCFTGDKKVGWLNSGFERPGHQEHEVYGKNFAVKIELSSDIRSSNTKVKVFALPAKMSVCFAICYSINI